MTAGGHRVRPSSGPTLSNSSGSAALTPIKLVPRGLEGDPGGERVFTFPARTDLEAGYGLHANWTLENYSCPTPPPLPCNFLVLWRYSGFQQRAPRHHTAVTPVRRNATSTLGRHTGATQNPRHHTTVTPMHKMTWRVDGRYSPSQPGRTRRPDPTATRIGHSKTTRAPLRRHSDATFRYSGDTLVLRRERDVITRPSHRCDGFATSSLGRHTDHSGVTPMHWLTWHS